MPRHMPTRLCPGLCQEEFIMSMSPYQWDSLPFSMLLRCPSLLLREFDPPPLGKIIGPSIYVHYVRASDQTNR